MSYHSEPDWSIEYYLLHEKYNLLVEALEDITESGAWVKTEDMRNTAEEALKKVDEM